MSWVKGLAYIGLRQTRNITRLAMGRQVTFPPLGSVTLDSDDIHLARSWLGRKTDWYRFNEIQQYHEAFAAWNGSTHTYSFMSARVALTAAIYALGLQPNDEVILPGYTCVVVPNSFHFAGVKTIYCDIELNTYGLDASQIETKITPKTRAILLHHLYGLVCRDYEEIISIARKHDLFVIEDCAQSTGAQYRGKKIGNWGDIAIYSSEQSKVFTTIQGGMVTTNNDALAQRLQEFHDRALFPQDARLEKLLHNVTINYYRFKHPFRWLLGDVVYLRYFNKQVISTTREEEIGVKPAFYGEKLPAPLASIGLNQLKKIEDYNETRRITAKHWDNWCDTNGYDKPVIIDHSLPVYLRYPVLVEPNRKQNPSWARDELGVELGVWFTGQLHPTNQSIADCPNAEIAVRQCVNFPGVIL